MVLGLFTVFDITGRKILSSNINDISHTIDLSQFPKGIYYLQTTDGINQYNENLILN